MNLDNFESEINPTIMKRGKNYFNQGLVEDLEETHAGLWKATIEGTEIYEVEVMVDSPNHKSIQQWYCSCPYNGPICKHVVATLLGIREYNANNVTTSAENNKVKQTTKKAQLEKIFEKTSREELIDYIRQLINDDKTIMSKTLLYFQSYTGEKISATNYNTRFNAIIKKYSSRGFIDYQSAKGFSRETWELTQSLNSSNIPSKVRVESCFKLLETMMKKLVDRIDDSNGDLADITVNFADILDSAYPELTKQQQTNCFKQVLFWEFESELGDYGLEQYLEHLAPMWANNNEELQEYYIKEIDKVCDSSVETWEEETNHTKKFYQLSAWGRIEEAEKLAWRQIDIPEFRRIFVDKAIKNKDFITAQSLIKIGIKLSKERKHPGVEADWRRILVDIAKHTNDVESLRAELQEMQKGTAFKIGIYRELKATYTAAEWQTAQTEIATKMLGKYYQIYNQAEIYAEENQLRELFDLIQSDEYQASSLFKRYLKILNKEFPEESANFYAIIIQHELEQTGRKIYQQAVTDIKALQKLPMGEAIAKQLIREVTLQYKNRPSMLEILKELLAKTN